MRLLVVLALFACVACDGAVDPDAGLDGGALDGGAPDAGAEDGGSDAGVLEGDLERDYCAPLAAVLCESADTCGCGGVLPGGDLDRAGCEAHYLARCMEAWSFLQDAVERGEARIRRDAALACVERVGTETPACARPSGVTTFATCEPIFTGPADLGEACSGAPVCADGSGACIEGACVARRAAGEACSAPFDCANGLICAGTCRAPAAVGETCSEAVPCAPELRCVSGACVAPGADGAACSVPAECSVGSLCTGGACAERASSSCGTDAECGNASRCAPIRTCGARLGAGASCDRDQLCAEGLYCDDTVGQCAALPGLDEPCVRGILCAAGLGCDELGGSICRAPGGEGAPCLAGEAGPSICAGDLGCFESDAGPVCGAISGGDGSRCTIDLRCPAGLVCAFERDGSFCRVARGDGEACEADRECADGLFCDFATNTCAAKRPAGEPCSSGNECAGVCQPTASGAFACADRPGDGDYCIADDDCGPERACVAAERGVCLDEICVEIL